MSDLQTSTQELEFSEKYTDEHARRYYHKHNKGFWRRLSNIREIAMARKALRIAGDPDEVLDLPSGTGRFWEMLAEKPGRKLFASDYNQSMLNVALQERPKHVADRFDTFQASAFDIPKPDNFVESIFCSRLLHHIGERDDRMKIFREFHRVTRDTVLVSMWVDGNLKARKRKAKQDRLAKHKYQNRFLFKREEVEAEMREAGFEILGHVDFLKYYAMWRMYVLKKV